MNEKELIEKLNNLKQIKPETAWKERNREILCSQIFNQDDKSVGYYSIFMNLLPQRVAAVAGRPAFVFMSLVLVVISIGAVSLRASNATKPGDSLYIAKIVSEKTQLALTFDEKQKAKLNLEFASNRAKEITQVMESSKQTENKKIEGLTKDFKNELSAAKTRLAKINPPASNVTIKHENVNNINNNQPVTDDQATQVFGASLEKSAEGMQLSDSVSNLDAAEKLFDQKDYQGSLSKIEEVNRIIDSPEAPKSASSTEPESKATSTK